MSIVDPIEIKAAGNMDKPILEFFGGLSGHSDISISRMESPQGWVEPGQTPDFDEYTLVLRGTLQMETVDGVKAVCAGQAVKAAKGRWVRYSTPFEEGADYIAVCRPAFSPDAVNRDKE